jgi:CRISPR-associated protein Cas2
MFFVVAYDVSDNQRRTRIAKILEDFGDRAQYSVFEMQLNSHEQLSELRGRIEQVMDSAADGVRVYFLCQSCREKATVLGQGQIYRDEDTYVI